MRQERIPEALLREYRARFRTLFDRADIYIDFYERALDLLAPSGGLGFIGANRWLTRNPLAGMPDLAAKQEADSAVGTWPRAGAPANGVFARRRPRCR